MPDQVRLEFVPGKLRVSLDAVVELVVQVEIGIESLQVGNQVAVVVQVVAVGALAILVKAGDPVGKDESSGTARLADGVSLEFAGRVGDVVYAQTVRGSQ